MAKTTADTTLVTGAATAYKNYDNDPAIYSGLDKVIKKGTELAEDSLKIERENKQKIDIGWDKISKDILDNNGDLQTNVDKSFTRAMMDSLKEEYILARRSNDKEALDNIQQKISKEQKYLKKYTDLRIDVVGVVDEVTGKISDGLSSAMDGTKEKAILTDIASENHEQVFVERKDENGNINQVRVFKGKTEGGEEYELTLEELESSIVRDSAKEAVAFGEFINKTAGTTFTKKNAMEAISNIVPSDSQGLRGFVANDVDLRGGRNFKSMLSDDKLLRQEVNDALIADERFNTDGNDVIDDDEFEVYLNAIVDINAKDLKGNSIWGGNAEEWMKYCRPIVMEKLYASLINADDEERVSARAKRKYPDLPKEEREIKYLQDLEDEKNNEEEGGGDEININEIGKQ
jgi:hypothetical protein